MENQQGAVKEDQSTAWQELQMEGLYAFFLLLFPFQRLPEPTFWRKTQKKFPPQVWRGYRLEFPRGGQLSLFLAPFGWVSEPAFWQVTFLEDQQ